MHKNDLKETNTRAGVREKKTCITIKHEKIKISTRSFRHFSPLLQSDVFFLRNLVSPAARQLNG